MTNKAGATGVVEHDHGVIRALEFQRYAVAVGDMNPIYFDDQAARDAGYDGIVAPTNYLTSVLNWGSGPTDDQLLVDGTEKGGILPELEGLRLMGGGHDLTISQPVRPGDRIRSRRKLVDKYERPSKMGTLHFAVYEITYTNHRGEHVVTCRDTRIAAE